MRPTDWSQPENEAPLELTSGMGTRAPRDHAWRRFALAGFLLGITSVFIVLLFAGAVWASDDAWQRLERVGTLTVVPFITLLGTAFGWYFSEKSASER